MLRSVAYEVFNNYGMDSGFADSGFVSPGGGGGGLDARLIEPPPLTG